MAEWYWMKDGQKRGPVDTTQLKQLAATGQLKPIDMIWREGLSQWVPASNAKGLEFGKSLSAQHVPENGTANALSASTEDGNLAKLAESLRVSSRQRDGWCANRHSHYCPNVCLSN